MTVVGRRAEACPVVAEGAVKVDPAAFRAKVETEIKAHDDAPKTGSFQRFHYKAMQEFRDEIATEKNDVDLLGLSSSNPYYIYPQWGRPFDAAPVGVPNPPDSALAWRPGSLARAGRSGPSSSIMLGIRVRMSSGRRAFP